MTEEELNKLADLIVEKILVRQAEYDAEFVRQIEKENNIKLEFVDAQKHLIQQEIEKLEVRLQKLLDREMYEAASRIVDEINHLKKQL